MLLNQTSPSGLGLAWASDLNSTLILAWQGSSGNNEINVMFTDGALTKTGAPFQLPGESTSDTPSVCYIGGAPRLFVAWKGSTNQNLTVAELTIVPAADATSLPSISGVKNAVVIPGATSDFAPSIAANGGAIILAFTGVGNLQLNYWTLGLDLVVQSSKQVGAETSSSAPSIMMDFGPYIAWVGTGNSSLNVVNLSNGQKDTFQQAGSAPSLANFQGAVFVAWRGIGNSDISILKQADWLTGANKIVLNGATNVTPALVGNNIANHLILGYAGIDASQTLNLVSAI
jgi:phage gp37-like protein